jgi:hypothetical protein
MTIIDTGISGTQIKRIIAALKLTKDSVMNNVTGASRILDLFLVAATGTGVVECFSPFRPGTKSNNI